MNRTKIVSWLGVLLILALLLPTPIAAQAQEGPQPTATPEPLTIYTQYPSRMIGFGEIVTLPLKVRAGTAQTVWLQVNDLPQGWNASFRGGAQIVADGARWIWEEQRKHLRDADGVLDVYHALQHIAATGQALFSQTDAATAWTDAARHILLRDGWEGIDAFLTAEKASRTPAERAELDSLRNYLTPHQLHLNYAARLRTGRSIGSGQVEGACKNLIGRRLKANAARWRVRRVNRMAGLCCLLYSDQWDTYWKTA